MELYGRCLCGLLKNYRFISLWSHVKKKELLQSFTIQYIDLHLLWLRLKIFVVNHGKQGFIHLKEKQKERREKRETRTHKPENRQGDCGRGGAPPAAREVPSHVALGVEGVRKRTVLVITKRRVVGLLQLRLARSITAEPLCARAENTPKPA